MRKTALIIGASGDIGSEIAIQLGKEGYQLLLHYNRNRDMLVRVREQVERESILAELQCDMSNIEAVKQLLAALVFRVDIIIFASGNAYYGLFQEMPIEKIDEMLTIHVKAPMMITKHLLPEMIRNKSGRIIFITSIWGEVGASNEVVYSALKGAQNTFVKALAKEVGASGITVNAVSPGYIDTKMNGHLLAEEKDSILAEIPVHRAGTSKEVAHTISFLMHEQAGYINGEIIGMNGGW
ncbi:SDR family oxidoreductase [Ornithinibacillus gellani]|uniref:elongation factor P 5-aminopentanone reductase n=1 Tax=Ornithinibacillus gellani TaxID=2293253 RepID=UPI000F47CE91|nr:SDR family oxidoreductase [Ornithinibacillus gellani]TQS75495.1 SDR family oxidoreductase [Ornithinibacillus gellani]